MQQIVAPGKVLVSYGPVELSISAYKDGQGVDDLALLGAGAVPELLADLAPYKESFKQSYSQIGLNGDEPKIVAKMYHSTAAFGDSSFTPMAAVASSIAGIIADKVFAAGATKVIVNNGGDIAVRLAAEERVKVGVAPSITEQNPSHYILLTADRDIRGISTSGFGGRSFTKGIASAAIAFSHDNGLSDVAATLIGNHTFSPDAEIEQVFAEEVYPDTDLVGHKVTASIGNLSAATKKKALQQGLKTAHQLVEQNLITGAVIFVQDFYGMVPEKIVQPLQN